MPRKRSKYQAPRSTEETYARALRRVARVVGSIIEPHIEGANFMNLGQMMQALRNYSDALGPWAAARAQEMLRSVAASTKRAFAAENRRFTTGIQGLIAEEAVGLQQQVLLREQVDLIKSLPTKAGEQAQTLATQAIIDGTRSTEIADKIRALGGITEKRAILIARTEVAKANSTLMEAQATAAGSEAYIWRTAGDEDVRESHAEMEGRVVQWNEPPTLSDGTTCHAGQIFNCRCFAEPIFTKL
jgi:SPP1 gp7 family putative phage head morphogenesis protein